MNKKSLMQNAHRITRKLVDKYGVNYRTQLGISLKYVYSQFKLYAENEIKNIKRDILLTLDKLVNTDDERFDSYYEKYKKYCLDKNVIRKYYSLKSFNAYMSNSLGRKYVMFNPSWHENYMVHDASKNIINYLIENEK